MKRLLLVLLAPVLLIGAVLFWARQQLVTIGDPGFFIAGIGRWSIETSLFVAGIGSVLAFVIFYVVIRLIIGTIRLPKWLKQRGGEQRSRKSQEALIAGMLESAEGNWEKAEKHLIRHAANSGVPLINYLTAARAAQSRGAYEQRDEYLKMAHESMPEAEFAIGLTKAELQMSDQQFGDALESLAKLNQIAPSHAKVLKMMHQVYAQAEDWEGLSRLIPKLHANKVMMEAEIKLLETQAYTEILKGKAELKNADALRDAWLEIPEHIRTMPSVQQVYFAAMIDAGAGVEVEPRLRELLSRDWSETSLVLYGCIPMPEPAKHLETAEKWLAKRNRDGVLLRLLGKLALRARQLDKAGQYIQNSLDIEPSVEAFRLMGDVLLQQDQAVKACVFFRNGLLYASNEAIAQVEEIQGVESLDASLARSPLAEMNV